MTRTIERLERIVSDIRKDIEHHEKNNDGSLEWVEDFKALLSDLSTYEKLLVTEYARISM